ncbi:MAG: PocR ligand-binding domain-containing protein [Anaerolineae bacterium]|nr:PocR ligand-binding domain-containing protein [Thermoflexales bacterium]MDW8395832.1 PocR ligand-binding domain-containing protein [Anaerolineae bacterium]
MAELLTTQQVQSLLKVDRTTIYRMVESGKLPAVRVGKQWRFDPSDIERWLGKSLTPSHASGSNGKTEGWLPSEVAQVIQDAFAEALGVTLVTTDLSGAPLTRVSNPCPLLSVLLRTPEALQHCISTWRRLADSLCLEPHWTPSETGLLCARGLIRVGSALKGMVIAGGVAPPNWPPTEPELRALAAVFSADEAQVLAAAQQVYRLDAHKQAQVLRFVQRVADILAAVASIHLTKERER